MNRESILKAGSEVRNRPQLKKIRLWRISEPRGTAGPAETEGENNMADNRIIECMERAQYILGNLMAVKPGEEVLIVVDPQTDDRMTQAMASAANALGAEWGVYMMPIRGKDKATISRNPWSWAWMPAMYSSA